MTFHEQLIHLRKERRLSQEQLGAEIGVTRQTVSKWELGDTTPEMDKLIQLSDFFGISIDLLVGRGAFSGTVQNGGEGACCPHRWHYEYKSRRSVRGVPLVHINIGRGPYKAKGLIAIGMFAKGLVAVGSVSAGILSFGAISAGVLSFGAASAGMLLAVGAISAGVVAVGGFSVGIIAIGGCAIGIYSMGGCAIASKIASGGYAGAPIAIGDMTSGEIRFDIHGPVEAEAIKKAILEKYPRTWSMIIELFKRVP